MFAWSLQATLRMEGGYSDDPDDPGGATRFGVSLRFLRAQGLDIDGDGDVDQADVQALTVEAAEAIYREHFWVGGRCDQIVSRLLAPKMFDMCVNLGSGQAWRVVQRALNRFSLEPLATDGIPGPVTLGALDSLLDEDWRVIELIRHEQRARYDWLIGANAGLAKYRRGWYRRAAY
jgi:lysozyme family protein